MLVPVTFPTRTHIHFHTHTHTHCVYKEHSTPTISTAATTAIFPIPSTNTLFCMTCNSTRFNFILFASDNLMLFAFTATLPSSSCVFFYSLRFALSYIFLSCFVSSSYLILHGSFINFTSNAFLCIQFSRRLLSRNTNRIAFNGCSLWCCFCCC